MIATLQKSSENWGDPMDIVFRSAKNDPFWIYYPLAIIVLITLPFGIFFWAFSKGAR